MKSRPRPPRPPTPEFPRRIDVHLHQADDLVRLLCTLTERIETMSAALDRLKQEVQESRAGVESVKTLVAGLAQQIRDHATEPAELEKLADELDAQQAELGRLVTENPQA